MIDFVIITIAWVVAVVCPILVIRARIRHEEWRAQFNREQRESRGGAGQ